MNLDSEQDGEVMENDAPDYALPAQRRGELLKVAKKNAVPSRWLKLRFNLPFRRAPYDETWTIWRSEV
jgi:hypothetical protein